MRQVTTDFVAACVQHAQQQQQHSGADSSRQRGQAAEAQQGSSTSSMDASSGSVTQPLCQVVCLGAGSDSSWFSLQQQGWGLLPAVRYIELDYHEVVGCKVPGAEARAIGKTVARKARTLLSSEQLLALLPDGTTATTAPAAADHPAAAAGPYLTWTKQTAAGHAATAAANAQQAGQHAEPAAAAAADSAGHSQGSADAAAGHEELAAGTAAAPSHSCGAAPPAAVASHVQELAGPCYSLAGVDLRQLQQLDAALARAGFDAKLPTLYVSECVLIYLEPAEAQRLLAAAAARTTDEGGCAAVAIFEQTRPDDAFGATMVANLEARGCPLRSVWSVPSPASQAARLLASGWTAAAAADMAAVYHGGSRGGTSCGAGAAAAGCCGWLRPAWVAERGRIERLELLDELEEWRLLQEHYCLALGVTGQGCGWLEQGLQLEQLRALGS
ncbi:S-adenosyl-L-methionine-dependent methyltransferase [Scenedesmus sp. NREL 46B-D3]|nr:S-adenosyl-L-methionine-dependent methyltransferase [Scenedesmus sp. NREL 46B-D3]